MSVKDKRTINERKFPNWIELQDGGRKYWLEEFGRHGWVAKYVKEVDDKEETVKFYQEVYDEKGTLIEVHEKFPIDKGHKKVKEE